MGWSTDGRNPLVQERRALSARAIRVIRVSKEFGLDGAYALSHVVWPDHEGGPPSMDVIEQAVALKRKAVAA